MYSGVLSDEVFSVSTDLVGISEIGVALGVVGELFWVSSAISLVGIGSAKSIALVPGFATGFPSRRRVSKSSSESVSADDTVKGFLTSLATLRITS